MPLVALVAASREAGSPTSLIAMQLLAGRVVLERQVRLVERAGAAPIVILAERLPEDLAAEIERLRNAGLTLRIARTPAEAAAAIGGEDLVLLLADGAVAETNQVEALLESGEPAVLTVPDDGFGETYERIDADSRWSGLAVCHGETVIETAMKLRDWDFISTLLRRILQGGGSPLAASGHVAIIANEPAADAFERELVAGAWRSTGGWASHMLAPVERLLTRALLGSRTGPHSLGSLAALLAGFGAGLLALGWFVTGYLALLLATPVEGSAQRLAQIRMEETESAWWLLLLPVLAAAALIGLANAMVPEKGWGLLFLAVTTLAFLAALEIERGDATPPAHAWLAERRSLVWALLPFALAGAWAIGLAALFVYAAASFFWVQNWAHPRLDRQKS